MAKETPSSHSPTPDLASITGEKAADVAALLAQPYAEVERALEKKERNLKKRLQRLQQYEMDRLDGKKLTADQIEAQAKMTEVEHDIDYVRDLSRIIFDVSMEHTRAKRLFDSELGEERRNHRRDLEEALFREAELREENAALQKELEERRASDTAQQQTVFTVRGDVVDVLKKQMEYAAVLQMMKRPAVRSAFVNGDLGARKLAESEFKLLDELLHSFLPTPDSCSSYEEYEKKIVKAADHVKAMLTDNQRNPDLDRRRSVLHTVATSKFFRDLKQNSLGRGNHQNHRGDRRGGHNKKEEPQDPPPPRAKSPCVLFMGEPMLPSPLAYTFEIGYDENLPTMGCTTSVVSAVSANVAAPVTSGPPPGLVRNIVDVSPPPLAAPKPTPAGSAEGSGTGTPIEPRGIVADAPRYHQLPMAMTTTSSAFSVREAEARAEALRRLIATSAATANPFPPPGLMDTNPFSPLPLFSKSPYTFGYTQPTVRAFGPPDGGRAEALRQVERELHRPQRQGSFERQDARFGSNNDRPWNMPNDALGGGQGPRSRPRQGGNVTNGRGQYGGGSGGNGVVRA